MVGEGEGPAGLGGLPGGDDTKPETQRLRRESDQENPPKALPCPDLFPTCPSPHLKSPGQSLMHNRQIIGGHGGFSETGRTLSREGLPCRHPR